ncbi:hypothetical protein B484DRAFT_33545, partial [Ochromonadaceae sp. CCMP2298]
MSKVRIESRWYHENPLFSLVSADALSLRDEYVKVALFLLRPPDIFTLQCAAVEAANKASKRMVTNSQELRAEAERAAQRLAVAELKAKTSSGLQYSVDIGTNIKGNSLGAGTPCTHSARVLGPDESPDLHSELRCLRLYGQRVLLGGSGGFLGVGSMGLASGAGSAKSGGARAGAEGREQVMFCVPIAGQGAPDPTPSTPSLGYPHPLTSTILALAAASHSPCFAAVDSTNTVSLWQLFKHSLIAENVEGLTTPQK